MLAVITLLKVPPRVSMPKANGTTSRGENHVFPGEQMSLDGCTDCNNFVRINRHMRRPAEKASTPLRTAGTRVEPPTKTTSSISLFSIQRQRELWSNFQTFVSAEVPGEGSTLPQSGFFMADPFIGKFQDIFGFDAGREAILTSSAVLRRT